MTKFDINRKNLYEDLLGLGYFKDEGLDINLVLFNENNSELTALESGKIDVGAFGSSELVTYLGEGHDITVFGGAMIAGHGLIVKPELVEGIPEKDWSLELLKGKNIGVEGVDSGHIVYRSALKKLGLENDVEFKVFTDGADAYNSPVQERPGSRGLQDTLAARRRSVVEIQPERLHCLQHIDAELQHLLQSEEHRGLQAIL